MKVACFGSQLANHQESTELNWNSNTLNFLITSVFKSPCLKTMNPLLNPAYFRRKTRQTQPSKWKHRQINVSTPSNSQLAAKHSQSRLICQMPKIWSPMRRLSQISTADKPYKKIIKTTHWVCTPKPASIQSKSQTGLNLKTKNQKHHQKRFSGCPKKLTNTQKQPEIVAMKTNPSRARKHRITAKERRLCPKAGKLR